MNKERELLEMWIKLLTEKRAVIIAEPYTAKDTRITDNGAKNTKHIDYLILKTTELINSPQQISPYNPAHAMYGNCCGIFNYINSDGILCCNECGITITELIYKIEYKKMNFETEYQLKEFEEIQHEYFDENGNLWGMFGVSNPTSQPIMERMLKLINQLKTEIHGK